MLISGTCSAQALLLVSLSPSHTPYCSPSLSPSPTLHLPTLSHTHQSLSLPTSPGNFALTPHQGEVVLALAADQPCQRLLAGDTAGHLTIFNIEHFCTAPQAVGSDIQLSILCACH